MCVSGAAPPRPPCGGSTAATGRGTASRTGCTSSSSRARPRAASARSRREGDRPRDDASEGYRLFIASSSCLDHRLLVTMTSNRHTPLARPPAANHESREPRAIDAAGRDAQLPCILPSDFESRDPRNPSRPATTLPARARRRALACGWRPRGSSTPPPRASISSRTGTSRDFASSRTKVRHVTRCAGRSDLRPDVRDGRIVASSHP